MIVPPRVSIVVPSYNVEAYISHTLTSALAQTHDAFEVILVDDGSTDGTLAVARSFSDCRLRVVEQANAGAAAARNHGLRLSRGEYVLFLDADDLISCDHLTALEAAIDGKEKHIAFGQWDRFCTDPAKTTFPDRPGYHVKSPAKWLAQEWRGAQPMMQCGMFLLPRKLLDIYGGWDERLTLIDDFEFFARLISGSRGLVHAPDAKLYYRSGLGASLSTRNDRVAFESAWLAIKLGTDHLLALEDSPRTRLACANILRSFDYDHRFRHPDLAAQARRRETQLGGGDLEPIGSPTFHRLRKLVGWKAARRILTWLGR